MSEDFNINLDSAVQGAKDVNSLGSTIAQNAQTQLEHSQLIAQAIERTKQAGITTAEQQKEFDTEAYLSSKGLMQKAQAMGQLKIIMQKQAIPDADQASILKTAEETLPEELDGRNLWQFWTALREPKNVAATRGTAFQATAADVSRGQKDVTGVPVVEGQGYIQDTDNNWIRSGQTQDQIDETNDIKRSAKGPKPGHEDDEWIKLNAQVQRAILGRMGVVGQIGQTITRADRAINTITHSNGPDGMLTKQDLENISTDIAAIYQGGVPGITQIVENSYGTTLTSLADTIRHYTGVLAHIGNKQVLDDSKKKLMLVLTDMRNSALAQMGKFVEMQFSGFRTMIEGDPARWERFQHDVQAFMSSGLLDTSGRVMPPSGAPPMAPVGGAPPPVAAPQAQATTAKGTVYSVSP